MYEVEAYIYSGEKNGVRALYKSLGYTDNPTIIDVKADPESSGSIYLVKFSFRTKEEADTFESLLGTLDVEGLYY